MQELHKAIPDVDVVLALAPEELGGKLLFLLRHRFGSENFHPFNLAGELASRGDRPGYALERDIEVSLAFVEAIAWLEAEILIVPAAGTNGQNGWRRLSRAAARFEGEAEFSGFAAARKLPKEILHPTIANNVWLSFVRGEYDVAVFHAMKAVEIAVREASGARPDQLGVRLARYAFDPNEGPLADSTAEGGERQARSDLFAGALGSYKNPQSHRHVALNDPVEAIEQILLASHLLRIVDGRRP